jgi:hypothetical protein
MANAKVPSYISSVFEEDCRELKIPRDFIIEIFSYPAAHEFGDSGRFCKPISVNGKKGVVIGFREESKGVTLGNFSHEMKHAQHFFTGDCNSPVFDELAAYFYGMKKSLEYKVKGVYKKIS